MTDTQLSSAREITAQNPTTCAGCGEEISKGAIVWWVRAHQTVPPGIYHEACLPEKVTR